MTIPARKLGKINFRKRFLFAASPCNEINTKWPLAKYVDNTPEINRVPAYVYLGIEESMIIREQSSTIGQTSRL